jgi:hypothetical protein
MAFLPINSYLSDNDWNMIIKEEFRKEKKAWQMNGLFCGLGCWTLEAGNKNTQFLSLKYSEFTEPAPFLFKYMQLGR